MQHMNLWKQRIKIKQERIGIWVAIPIGWFLSDLTGILGYKFINKNTEKTL